MAEQAIEINFEGLEDVFRICGRQTAMAALDQRLAQHMKEHDPRVQRFLARMAQYDKPRLLGSPASPNNEQRDDIEDLNYFAPKKNLQEMLCDNWFDQVSADKKKYTKAWREQFVEKLMDSDYRHDIARKWKNKDQRLQVKGRLIGSLIKAGVINKKALAVARVYYGTHEENTKEVNTLAKYMGDSRKENYSLWVAEYVSSPPSH